MLDKWFTLQAAIPEDGTLDRVRRSWSIPPSRIANPNRVRSLVGSFAMLNQTQFNRADGAGYDFLADIVLRAGRAESAARGAASDGFQHLAHDG